MNVSDNSKVNKDIIVKLVDAIQIVTAHNMFKKMANNMRLISDPELFNKHITMTMHCHQDY